MLVCSHPDIHTDTLCRYISEVLRRPTPLFFRHPFGSFHSIANPEPRSYPFTQGLEPLAVPKSVDLQAHAVVAGIVFGVGAHKRHPIDSKHGDHGGQGEKGRTSKGLKHMSSYCIMFIHNHPHSIRDSYKCTSHFLPYMSGRHI